MRAKVFGVTAASAALLAIPTSAGATTATFDQKCYTKPAHGNAQPVNISISGATPGDSLSFTAEAPGKPMGSLGSSSTPAAVGADGTASDSIANLGVPNGTSNPTRGQTVEIKAIDTPAGGGAQTTSVLGSIKVTTLAMSVASKPASPTQARAVTISGWPFAGQKMYAFVTDPKARKTYKRMYLGRADTCGYISHKEVIAPSHYKDGHYRLYVEAATKFTTKKSRLYYPFQIYR